MARTGAIIQARMRSSRLPGKVLREVAGRTLLGHLIARLTRAASLDLVLVATSDDASDDAVAAEAKRHGVPVHRGPLYDVAARFRQAVERTGLDVFVRVSGDSPLLDPALVDRVVSALTDDVDVATNVHPRSFPRGQSVEVVRTDAFRRALPLIDAPTDSEHVTPVFYRHPELFRIRNVRSDVDRSAMRMVVDDVGDLERFERAVARMSRPPTDVGLDELIEIYLALSVSGASA